MRVTLPDASNRAIFTALGDAFVSICICICASAGDISIGGDIDWMIILFLDALPVDVELVDELLLPLRGLGVAFLYAFIAHRNRMCGKEIAM